MNNTIRKILVLLAAVCVAAPALNAKTANKTFFSGRNELQQNGRVWAASAPYGHGEAGDRGLTTSVLGFASKTKNTLGLGRYFGMSLKNDGSDANGTVTISESSSGLPNGLFDRQIDHTFSVADDESAMRGAFKLAPVQKRIGAVLGASVDLSYYFDVAGWHVAVAVPVVQVTNNLGVTYTSSTAAVGGDNKTAAAASTVEQFFVGNYRQAGSNSQADLNYGKVAKDDHTSLGVADMKITVAYDIVREVDGGVQLNGGLIVPLGAKPTAERLFEAFHGNGGHVGIVAGATGDVLVWENKEKHMAVWLSGQAEYTFLFESREKRIAGIYNATEAVAATVPWGHAGLGVALNSAGTFPLANVLARDMNVMPGSHFEATMGGTFVWKDFYVNLGYNMYYKKQETVDLADQWPADRYGMATYGYQGTSAATDFSAIGLADTGHAAGPINVRYSAATHLADATVQYQIDTAACTAVDQELHQAVLGVGYARVMKDIPFNASIVASYELSKDRTKAPNAWGLGVRIGVAL